MNEIEKIEYKRIQRHLRQNKKLCNFNYRGERTFVVISGLNSDKFNLKNVKGLKYYEERMLFFLFLLSYKKTKIIYVTSENFNTNLFDYYIRLISKKRKEIDEMKSRFTHIEVLDDKHLSLTNKILSSKKILRQISKKIVDKKTAVLRCYNPTADERKLAVALQVPLFGSGEKFDYVGTKSGGRKVFSSAGLALIPGTGYIKSFSDLTVAMAKLIKNYPLRKRLIIKLDKGASGRGNCIFNHEQLLLDNDLEVSAQTEVNKLASLIKNQFKKYCQFELTTETPENYVKEFNRIGGIVELYIKGEIKFSPSVQLAISVQGTPSIVSTHEQILGGLESQKFLGCAFPSLPDHRKSIVQEAKKVAIWMAKKGMIGNFGIDFIVNRDTPKDKPEVYPIEINLRKGGTTHPFRIAHYLTKSKYKADGLLYSGKTPIYYLSRDLIENKEYKKISANELIELVKGSKIHFNKYSKRGVLVFMPGAITKYGKFGAICIGHSSAEAENYYKKLIRLINNYLEKKA
jgi:hypothetical protein